MWWNSRFPNSCPSPRHLSRIKSPVMFGTEPADPTSPIHVDQTPFSHQKTAWFGSSSPYKHTDGLTRIVASAYRPMTTSRKTKGASACTAMGVIMFDHGAGSTASLGFFIPRMDGIPQTKWCIISPYHIYIYIDNTCMYNTSSTTQGGGDSFENRKTIGELGCCESRMAERIH